MRISYFRLSKVGFALSLAFCFSAGYAGKLTCPDGNVIRSLAINHARLIVDREDGWGEWMFSTTSIMDGNSIWNVYFSMLLLPTTDPVEAMSLAQPKLNAAVTVIHPRPVFDYKLTKCVYRAEHNYAVVVAFNPPAPPV